MAQTFKGYNQTTRPQESASSFSPYKKKKSQLCVFTKKIPKTKKQDTSTIYTLKESSFTKHKS